MTRFANIKLSCVLSVFAALFLSIGVYASAYTAEFSAQFDKDFNEFYGEWPTAEKLKTSTAVFNADVLSSIIIEFDTPVAFSGVFAAIETDMPYPGSIGEIVSLKLDGAEIEVRHVLNDAEGLVKNETLRLVLCNQWDFEITEQPADLSALGAFSALEVSFVVTPADNPPAESITASHAAPVFDPYGAYTAYLGLQTDSWIFREEWANAAYGANGLYWGGDNHFNRLYHVDTAMPRLGAFTNAEIAGNGTYRVSLNGLTREDALYFNRLFVSTDIPISGDITVTDVKVTLGGDEIYIFNEGYVLGINTNDKNDYYVIYCVNIWDAELSGLFDNRVTDGEVAIEFTLSGFAYDKTEETITPLGAEDVEPNTYPPALPIDKSPEIPLWVIVLCAAGALAIAVNITASYRKVMKIRRKERQL